ncbi:nucleoside diphosphate-linked moiety X motif 17-like [Rhopilema esculentum]|uniref:nucleoside diphosphate-linked moiety X motif 17-like n=1 Tax=Rhopilema esculentum TaxID=499914 RepID=UPI0031D2722D
MKRWHIGTIFGNTYFCKGKNFQLFHVANATSVILGHFFSANMASSFRSKVFLKETATDCQERSAVFEKCILRRFGCKELKMTVGFQYNHGRLTIFPAEEGVRFEHPPGCPCCFLTANDTENISQAHKDGGVRVGVSVLIQSSDKRVLITRRSKHLRTFPGVWVPPGGHLEEGETLEEAALRELEEETGLTVEKAQYGEGLVLGLWESVYPPLFSMGLPKRHHVVVYLLAKSKKSSSQLDSDLKLDENEVDAAAWLDEGLVRQISQSDAHGQAIKTPRQYFNATVIVDGLQKPQDLCQSKLMASAPVDVTHEDQDFERLSSGTKFALRQWMRTLFTEEGMPKITKADSIGSLFHVITHEGHKPAKFPFLG